MKPTCPERLSTSATPVFREVPGVSVLPRPATTFALPQGSLWSTEPRRGLPIHCVEGQIWITQAGDGRDVVLCPGETFIPGPKGRVVVQALLDSRIELA